MESGSLPEIEEINFTSSDNKSPIVNCDPPRGQQKWGIISCKQYPAAHLKDHPNVTLIGRASGGGSCVVRACTTASGTIFTISSPIQISTLKNGSLYNADQGIVPDFTISKYDTFYDREKLVDFIHQLP
jgi:hypothetical protein